MAKFINKKEQVWDLQLTTYGRYLLSLGNFKPTYYAFYDDNVIYDYQYAATGTIEPQNNVHNRIKNETQYLEGLTLFEDLEVVSHFSSGEIIDWKDLKNLKAKRRPRQDIFKLDSAIGDAYLDGDSNLAPAWKVVALESTISSSTTKDLLKDQNIPQINVDANYVKKVKKATIDFDPEDARGINLSTAPFADNKIIVLEQDEPLFYVEEVNTQLLTENFEIEIFEIESNSREDALLRKYFESFIPQVQNGIMVSPTQQKNPARDLTTGSVEYYFDVLLDKEINQNLACQGAEVFNKQSYYVNLDFDCERSKDITAFYDIYGSVTEPEICID
jgi:hypothetical protein